MFPTIRPQNSVLREKPCLCEGCGNLREGHKIKLVLMPTWRRGQAYLCPDCRRSTGLKETICYDQYGIPVPAEATTWEMLQETIRLKKAEEAYFDLF